MRKIVFVLLTVFTACCGAYADTLTAKAEKMKTLRFSGKIEKICILVPADGPNYFVVNGKQVIFAEASEQPDPEPWGETEGFGKFQAHQDVCTTYNGQKVEVYALEQQAAGADLKPVLFYTLRGSQGYYVRLLKKLTAEEAETLALKLVNQNLQDHPLKSWDGTLMTDLQINAPWVGTRVTKKGKSRWEFRRVPTAGLCALVSFDPDGANPDVSTSWSAK
jgi:hypothetical protein